MQRKNLIDEAFQRRKALICYAPVGDPLFPDHYVEIMSGCGVDVIEIGLPNSNPYADGRTISASMKRVGATGMTLCELADRTAKIRSKSPDLASVWMCYEDADFPDFDSLLCASGIDGLIMVGFEKRPDKEKLARTMAARNVHHIRFVSTSVSAEEIEHARTARGYVFLQASRGKTGVRDGDLPSVSAAKISRIRQAGVMIPIVLGFGISHPGQAGQSVVFGADGIVTGSACVEAALKGEKEFATFLSSMRNALDQPCS